MLPLTIRSLSSVDEVPAWSTFVGTRGFAHRAGDPGRFLSRFNADVTATHSRVLVATLPDAAAAPRLVGGVRLVERSIALDCGGARAAHLVGWADVCSEPDLRGRGIVGALLAEARTRTDALTAECEARDGAPAIALLHAAEAVRGLYEKFGFARGRLDVAYARVPLRAAPGVGADADAGVGVGAAARALGEGGSAGLAVARADFSRGWRELDALRASTLSRCRVVGATARDGAYWTRWVPITAPTALALRRPADGALLAYGAVVARDGVLRVVDWARAAELGAADARAFLRECARVACGALADDASVAMPLALARDALGGEDVASDAAVSDAGWMVRAGSAKGEDAVALLAAAAADGRFCVFVADSF
jgi:hypothetical protein